jgi:hypothetical protein
LALVLAFAAVGVGQGQVTYVGITNFPLTGRDVTLTIAGLSFATTDVSSTVMFGEQSAGHVCATTAWSTNTAVQCYMASFPTPVYVPKNNAGRVLVRAVSTGLSISGQSNNPLAYLSFDGARRAAPLCAETRPHREERRSSVQRRWFRLIRRLPGHPTP